MEKEIELRIVKFNESRKNIVVSHKIILEDSLKELYKFKQDVNSFFDNVKVNDENELIKKNRLELLNLLCKSFDNFFNFSKIES